VSSIPPPVMPKPVITDPQNITTIKTTLRLQSDPGLPFKPNQRAKWTEKERLAASGAITPNSLDQLEATVCLVLSCFVLYILNSIYAAQLHLYWRQKGRN
jgi:hypothetical protein